MNKKIVSNITISAMFIALGIVLPIFTGQIPQIGKMLLPMHIPVFLCALICGWRYGAIVGFILPYMRYMIFGMPVLFPTGIAMSVELCTYGLVAGFLYNSSKWQCIIALYRSLIISMLAGRILWGITQIALLGLSGKAFTWQMFAAGAFFNAIPGIIIQLILIPVIMVALRKTGLVHMHAKAKNTHNTMEI